MSDRFSQRIVLCEDEEHSRLVSAYLRRCGLRYDPPYVTLLMLGSVVNVVRDFPKQLEAVRKRSKMAKTQLIVVMEADEKHSVTERRQQLQNASAFTDADPVAVLIPKRHIESWFRSALGQDIDEANDCKRPGKNHWDSEEIRTVAARIHEWSRDPASAPTTCVSSLRESFTEWRKIG